MDRKKYGRRYSKEDDDYLRKHYPSEKTEDVAKTLNRSIRSVRIRAEKLGVRKTEEFRRQMYLNWGAKTRFGINGRYNSGKITKPIGSTRICPYTKMLQVRVTLNGDKKDWVYAHRLIWKQHHGEIPDDHIVTFKDGNKENLDISNLMLISKKDKLKEMSGRYSEIRPIMILLGRLNKEIKRKANGK